MALKEAYMEHIHRAGSVMDVVIKPDENESYRVKKIYVQSVGVPQRFMEVKVGRATVGFFLVEADERNHLLYDFTQSKGRNLIDELDTRGFNVSYPVATGESFTIRDVPANVYVKVVYEIYDEGDITKVMPNGSESKEYYLLNYGYLSLADIKANTYCRLNKSFLPEELPGFPFSECVPANTEIDLIGIFGVPSYFGRTTNIATYTERVRLVRGRVTMFTKQVDGFLFESWSKSGTTHTFTYGVSQIGFGADMNVHNVLFFPKPITFTAGEELGVYVKFGPDVSAMGIPVEEGRIRLGFIERIRRLA